VRWPETGLVDCFRGETSAVMVMPGGSRRTQLEVEGVTRL
jgi:hypothetical protein